MTATCTTCSRPFPAPSRQILNGRIIAGCVDKCHDAHLVNPSSSAAWVSQAVKSFRAAGATRFRTIVK